MFAEMVFKLRETVVERYLKGLRASSQTFTEMLRERGGEGDDAEYLHESLSRVNTAIKQWEEISISRINLADRIWGLSILTGGAIGIVGMVRAFGWL